MLTKRTKIVCTIGPASQSRATLRAMIKAGMDVARINFSHGTAEANGRLIESVRGVAKSLVKPVAIMADLQGPRLRLGVLPTAGLAIKPGETVVLDTQAKKYQAGLVPIDFPGLAKDLKIGDRILIEDGKMELKVKQTQGAKIFTTASNLTSKTITLPVVSNLNQAKAFVIVSASSALKGTDDATAIVEARLIPTRLFLLGHLPRCVDATA